MLFRDGATEEGVFWESINFAALHKLPIIFIMKITNMQFILINPEDLLVMRYLKKPSRFDNKQQNH